MASNTNRYLTRFADDSPESRDNSKDTNVSAINKDIDNDRVNKHNKCYSFQCPPPWNLPPNRLLKWPRY